MNEQVTWTQHAKSRADLDDDGEVRIIRETWSGRTSDGAVLFIAEHDEQTLEFPWTRANRVGCRRIDRGLDVVDRSRLTLGDQAVSDSAD